MPNQSGSFGSYIRGQGESRVIFRVTAIEGPVTGSWAKMFQRMFERGEAFVLRENIEENQVLITLTTTQETWSWTEAITNYENACDFPSTSIYPNTTRYPC